MDESIRDVMNKDGGENFEWYRRASGKIMGEVFVEVLQPLYDEHPDLVPDQLRPKELGSGWTRTKIKAVLVAQTMAQKL